MSSKLSSLNQAMMQYHPNWLLRLLKFKFKERNNYEFKWGSFTPRSSGLELQILQFSEDEVEDGRPWSLSFMLFKGRFFLNFPFKIKGFEEKPEEYGQHSIRTWGFSWRWFDPDMYASTIHFSWRHHTKYVELPWSFVHVQSTTLMNDGTWRPHLHYTASEAMQIIFEHNTATETYPYHYLLPSGDVQHCMATIHIEEREWRRRGWKKYPWFNLVRRTVEVRFDEPVGKGKGGGCIACSTELLIDQTPRDALKQMERTRRF